MSISTGSRPAIISNAHYFSARGLRCIAGSVLFEMHNTTGSEVTKLTGLLGFSRKR